MDITPDFNDCLLQRNAEPVSKPHFSPEKLNKFLQEAYNINSRITELTTYLRAIRPSYLTLQPHRTLATRKPQPSSRDKRDSAHQLTDNDRIRIDHETKILISSIASAIKELSQTAALDSSLAESIALRKRSKRGFGALGRWAAGVDNAIALSPEEQEEERKQETVKLFRENVIWLLQRRVEAASERQSSMIEIRLERERERSKSALYRAKIPLANGALQAPSSTMGNVSRLSGAELQSQQEQAQKAPDFEELSAEQQQIFQKEEQDMLRFYNEELNKIKTAESSLMEISSLQSQLAMNLETQTAHIDQLVQDSFLTTENVGQGNKELKKASERPSTARMVFYATCGYCATLIIWDWFI